MKYKFRKLTTKPLTSDFWYDITEGGYLYAEQFSSDPATIEAINQAIQLLQKLEEMCELE